MLIKPCKINENASLKPSCPKIAKGINTTSDIWDGTNDGGQSDSTIDEKQGNIMQMENQY